jgi:DNA-binding transcriptional LysR family regulator
VNIALVVWVVCASPFFLADAGRPARPEELASHSCLIHTNVTSHDRIWHFEPTASRTPAERRPLVKVKVKGAFFSNSALALRKAALANLGIALIPRYVIPDDLAARTLIKILPRHRPPPRPLFAVYPRATTTPPRVRLFIAFLRDWIDNQNVNDRRH